MSSTKLDVIIFGASGFTGKYTVFEAIGLLSNQTWGIAGRNRKKLLRVLNEMGGKAGVDISNIPFVVADANDQASLLAMADKCKTLVNCVGPYTLNGGEAVVKACIEAGTHYVDISGEPQFVEGMQLKYHTAAENKGVYIVSACGFESIPVDLGTLFVEDQFGGVVNSVRSYTSFKITGLPALGIIHYGTWASLVHSLGNPKEIKEVRQKLYNKVFPDFQPKLTEKRLILHKSFQKKWSLPLPGPDRSCVRRTQRFLYETEKKRPVQMKSYISFGYLIETFIIIILSALIWLMLKFKIGRKQLLSHPRLFSLGMVSHTGPSENVMHRMKYEIHFEGQGWEEKLSSPEEKYSTPPNKMVRTKITGSNPAYGATCVAVLLAARTILLESDKMPGKGGVLPPGAAFAKTNLISELNSNGIKFEFVSRSRG